MKMQLVHQEDLSFDEPEIKRRLVEHDDLEGLSEFELARLCSKTWSMEQE